MVEHKLPKLDTGVRFPSPAPDIRRIAESSHPDETHPRYNQLMYGPQPRKGTR